MKRLASIALLLTLAVHASNLPPTTSKGVGDAAGVLTFNYQFPNFAITHTGTTASLGVLGTAGGGTGQSAFTDGQLLIGNTATGSLSKATLTAGSGISITNGNGSILIDAIPGGGTVTSASVVSANGFSGSVATATTTPAITLNTTVNGIVKGNGTALSAATSGTDYAPGTSGNATGLVKSTTGTGALSTATSGTDYSAGTSGLATGILKSTTATGSLSIAVAGDFPTLNQNTTGTASNVTGTVAVANGGTGQTTYTDGQLLIGNSSGNTLSKATLTAGSNVTITNGNGSITIASTGGSSTAYAPAIQTLTTAGSGTFNSAYVFAISSGSATVGATYTNNAVTFTVLETVSSGTVIHMSGSGAPAASGTLTKATGTGDATLTFSAYKAPLYWDVLLIGAGGGGGAGSPGANNGTAGGDTTFGSGLTAPGGNGGFAYGSGPTAGPSGTAPTNTSGGQILFAVAGGAGGSSGAASGSPGNPGGRGGVSYLGGGAAEGANSGGATGPAANSGSGGAGGTSTSNYAGTGGAAGAAIRALIYNPPATISYTVGAKGSRGSGGTYDGTAGADGLIAVTSHYQ